MTRSTPCAASIPVSQRTTGRLEAFRRLPAREAPIGAEQADALLDRLVGRARAVLAEAPPTEEGLGRLTEGTLAGLEGAAALYRDDLVPILDFVPSDLVVWEPEAVRECLERVWEEVHAAHQEADLEAIPPPEQSTWPRRSSTPIWTLLSNWRSCPWPAMPTGRSWTWAPAAGACWPGNWTPCPGWWPS
ncbi:MAG: hypothetical protein Q9Q13_00935 [Acidobacteriota bacterium]|nr:hypothetical protein [Acidobacteriota bacterium]